jgi:excisionase family DNA binding protein
LNEAILLTKNEVARLLSVSLRTVDNLVSRKELMPRRIGRRLLFERRTLEQFARRDHKTRDTGNVGAHVRQEPSAND